MAEVLTGEALTLSTVLSNIKNAPSAKARDQGWRDLKRVLTLSRQPPSMAGMRSSNWLLTFQELFYAAARERAAWLKTQSAPTQASDERLGWCAEGFRAAVDYFCPFLERKTIKAFIGHVIQSVTMADGGLCKPLTYDYLKALDTVLDYQPHVEHLDPQTRTDLIEFCISSIGVLAEENATPTSHALHSRASALKTSLDGKDPVVVLVACIHSLARPTNCHLFQDALTIVSCMCGILRSRPGSGGAQSDAFEAIDMCIASALTHSVEVVMQIASMVLPLIRASWWSKSHRFRNRMLSILVHLHIHISAQAGAEMGEKLSSPIRALLDTMERALYDDPERKYHLTLDDMMLTTRVRDSEEVMPLQIPVMVLWQSSPELECNWTTLAMIAFCINWLDAHADGLSDARRPDGNDERSPKRRRRASGIEDLVIQTTSNNDVVRVRCVLQILTFVVAGRRLPEVEVGLLVDCGSQLMSHDNSDVASWAMILLTSCVFQPKSCSKPILEKLASIWHLIIRAMSTPTNCRAACHLGHTLLRLGLVSYEETKELLEDFFFSNSLSGPATLCDTALALWSILSRLRATHVPGQPGLRGFEQMLSWIRAKWSPSNFENKIYLHQLNCEVSAHALIAAFNDMVGRRRLERSSTPFARLGSLGHAWLWCKQNSTFLEWLLLFNKDSPMYPPRILEEASDQVSGRVPDRSLQYLAPSALTYLIDEVEKSDQKWTAAKEDRSGLITIDMLQSALNLCLVSNESSHIFMSSQGKRAVTLGAKSINLATKLIEFATHAEGDSSFDKVLNTIAPLLPSLSLGKTAESLIDDIQPMASILDQISLHLQLDRGQVDGRGEIDDSMEVDDDFSSFGPVASQSHNGHQRGRKGRSEAMESSDVLSFRISVIAYCKFLTAIYQESEASTAGRFIPGDFFRLLESLPDQALFASRSLLRQIQHSPFAIKPEDAESLLVHIGERVLPIYKWNRSEEAACAVIEIMSSTAVLWTDTEVNFKHEIGDSYYDWLFRAVKGGMLATAGSNLTSRLLFRLLHIAPHYAETLGKPSSRTTLFELLNEADVFVQYHITQQLPDVFDSFVLGEHSKLFDDIVETLPTEVGHIESICIRLTAFASIGGKWRNLLHLSLYRIFETVAHIPEVSRNGKVCVAQMVSQLGIESPRQLFKFFSSQILYAWLDKEPLSKVPFEIFGYDDLPMLIRDVPSDFASFCGMRGNQQQSKDLQTILGKSEKVILTESFTEAVGYAIASDIGKGTKCHEAEARMREVLGKPLYVELLNRHFHAIIAHFFLHLDHEDDLERTMNGKPGYEEALKVIRSINKASQAPTPMSQSQLPSWGPVSFLDQLERLCRRVGKDPKTIWTSAMVALVGRKLLNSTHHVYGPIHACRVIQRIKFLVCLAGSTCNSGYSLELFLRGLRSFCTDKNTSPYALPVLKHLLESGRDYLIANTALMAEICLPLLLSLRDLLGSTQDTTTQESTHRAMLSRAQEFRKWLFDFMSQYLTRLSDDTTGRNFRRIMEVAKVTSSPCDGSRHTSEGQLLRLLLQESQSQSSVLGRHTTEICLLHLCQDFGTLSRMEDDIVANDSDAAQLAFEIWRSLQFSGLSSNYLIWASRAIGHAFLHTGQVDHRIASETNLKRTHSLQQSKALGGDLQLSKQRIVEILNELTRNSNSEIGGLAEVALHEILVAYEGTEDYEVVVHPLSEALVETILGHDRIIPTQDVRQSLRGASIQDRLNRIDHDSLAFWARGCVLALLDLVEAEPTLTAIRPLLIQAHDGFAEAVFHLVLHIVLHVHHDQDARVIASVSEGFNLCFQKATKLVTKHIRILMNALLYLRMQHKPRERTQFDRNDWLQVDYGQVVAASQVCGLSKTGLMLLEISQNESAQVPSGRTSRRSSSASHELQVVPNELIVPILKAIDEPDAYYGIEQPPDLEKIAERLEYEGNNLHSLLFRGAQSDSIQRTARTEQLNMSSSLLPSLAKLNLNTLVNTIAAGSLGGSATDGYSDCLFTAAMKLGQWDLPTQTVASTNDSILYHTMQDLKTASSIPMLAEAIEKGMLDIHGLARDSDLTGSSLASSFQSLAALCELHGFASRDDVGAFDATMAAARRQRPWMDVTRVDRVSSILTCRESFASILNRNAAMRDILKLGSGPALLAEVELNLQSSKIYRKLGAQQESLSTVTYLSQLVEPLQKAGLSVDAAVKVEISHALWDRGELGSSIKTLQALCRAGDLANQAIPVGKAGLFANLAHHVSYARLEKPDDILANYLRPALTELKDRRYGAEAGKVFHEYATYCHNQLDNPDILEELRRSERFKRQREIEVRDLSKAESTAVEKRDKDALRKEYSSVSKWLKIDKLEIVRLEKLRAQFLQSSLGNYLRSLAASDDYDTDVIRFLAIWLAHAELDIANPPVGEYSPQVPTRKFAPLMNQLGSRLQNTESEFQRILGELVVRICIDHPYHSMHHVFAGSNSSGGHDSQAQSRKGAASKISTHLKEDERTGDLWRRIHRSNELYNQMAKLRSQQIKQGARLQMKDFDDSRRVHRDIPKLEVPPITMAIDIRDDCNYSQVPTVSAFSSGFSVPGGISAPKIVTALATDGRRYKQLFKGGSDDLRQDAIMEQVFEQVTVLLKYNKATRQRALSIRTYKVIPLDSTSGAIEFVEPTVSLMEYLDAAHQRYNSKDLKFSAARQKLSDASDLAQSQKVKVYEEVCTRFSPVLRHFFFEKYEDPEDWFDKRLAYTRSTAAISILGHILGLGDRHCQNILLDTSTGEVVHIDLGVAFEAGRILPKPETVPFRLTRDIIDGFGILKTEGVFRRCCEFTLEALRQNKDTILTLLNVLRYDPLYSWSVSPLRAKRIQNEQESRMQEEQAGSVGTSKRSKRQSKGGQDEVEQAAAAVKEKRPVDEGGEADRALGTVERKLAAGLSVSATVNELIQQATDERNLAVLFHGKSIFGTSLKIC